MTTHLRGRGRTLPSGFLPSASLSISKNSFLTDPARMRALRATGLLDRDPAPALDRLVRLASNIFEAPVSLVSLVEADRQFFAAQVGLASPWSDTRETPLSHSFCKHVVESGDALVIADATLDDRLAGNPAIEDLRIRAYAGVPLHDEDDDHTLGSFCVIDDEPREWTPRELDILRDLADAAMTEIRLRRATNDVADALEQMRRTLGS